MTYLQTNRKSGFGRRFVIGLPIIIGLIFVVVIRLLWPQTVSNLFSTVFSPFWRSQFALSSGSMKSSQTLLAQNEILKSRISDMENRLMAVQAIEQENTDLKSFLGRTKTIGMKNSSTTSTSTDTISTVQTKNDFSDQFAGMILAPILVRPPSAPFDELVIDGGKDLLFESGDKIYIPGNILVGYIKEVSKNTSKVVLYSSPNEVFDVIVPTVSSSSISIQAFGKGGGQYYAEIPKSIVVKRDGLITVPSIGNEIIGKIVSIISDQAEPFETILFAPPVNIYEARWVFVKTDD